MSTVDTGLYITNAEASHELYSVVTEITPTHLGFALLAVFILIFGMFSALIKERFYAGEAIVATGFGIIFGPHCANLINPRSWGDPSFDNITLEFTRVVLALSVFAVGVELPRAYVKRHWKSLFMVIVPNMISGWLIVAGLIYGLVPGLSFLASLVVAACLTPTDPILAASVVGKGKFAQKHVPSHIRHLLQAESGCNDGAAFPFLYLALFLNYREANSAGSAIGHWILLVILYQIILGIVIGTITGIAARKVLKFSKRRSLIDRESMVAMYVSLAIFTTFVTTLAGSDDLLAAFSCGAAFAWDDWFSESIEDSNFSNIIDLLVNCATFIYIGATMPFSDWNNPNITLFPWRLAVLGIGILTIRRLPAMMLLYKWIPDIKTFREAVFAGHFGPMGVGAIFISTLALTKLPTPAYPPQTRDDLLALTIQPIIYFAVLCSILIHGFSIPFFSLGRRVHSLSRSWTQTSNSEPSWLSRVKRVGDSGIEINRDDDSPNPNEKENENEKRRRTRDVDDLEAGVIDDDGMDIGEMTERDYTDNETGGAEGVRIPANPVSPNASSTSAETMRGSGNEPGKGKGKHQGPDEDRTSDQEDARPERHDDDPSDEEEVWQEGDDIVVERNDGEDCEVIHQSDRHQASPKRHDATEQDQTPPNSGDGPGFPGHRMAEIANLIERGHDLAHKMHGKSNAERVQAKAEGQLDPKDQSVHEHALHRAAKKAVMQEEEIHARGIALKADERPGKPAVSRKEQDGSGGRQPVRQLSSVLLGGSKTGQRPGRMERRSTLSPEEKYARDAWCRKERRDVDDDEVKAWVSGKHLVIESKKGEDVRIIDANPDKGARERARRDPDLNIREVDISRIHKAKNKIFDETSKSPTSQTGSIQNTNDADRPSPTKRFDLRMIADRSSFRRLIGKGAEVDDNHTSIPHAASPVLEEEEEETNDRTGRLRFAEGTQAPSRRPSPSRTSAPARGDGGGDYPNYLSTRKTGIPLSKTETTDSQVHFATLPEPRRK